MYMYLIVIFFMLLLLSLSPAYREVGLVKEAERLLCDVTSLHSVGQWPQLSSSAYSILAHCQKKLKQEDKYIAFYMYMYICTSLCTCTLHVHVHLYKFMYMYFTCEHGKKGYSDLCTLCM